MRRLNIKAADLIYEGEERVPEKDLFLAALWIAYQDAVTPKKTDCQKSYFKYARGAKRWIFSDLEYGAGWWGSLTGCEFVVDRVRFAINNNFTISRSRRNRHWRMHLHSGLYFKEKHADKLKSKRGTNRKRVRKVVKR